MLWEIKKKMFIITQFKDSTPINLWKHSLYNKFVSHECVIKELSFFNSSFSSGTHTTYMGSGYGKHLSLFIFISIFIFTKLCNNATMNRTYKNPTHFQRFQKCGGSWTREREKKKRTRDHFNFLICV